jgi:hypothetical protein
MDMKALVFCSVTCSLVDRFQLYGATYCLSLQGRSEQVCATITLNAYMLEAPSLSVGLVAGHLGRHSVVGFPIVCRQMPGQHLEINHGCVLPNLYPFPIMLSLI